MSPPFRSSVTCRTSVVTTTRVFPAGTGETLTDDGTLGTSELDVTLGEAVAAGVSIEAVSAAGDAGSERAVRG